jgi:hypothetical protein
METIYTKNLTSIDLYNLCLAFVKGGHDNSSDYRVALLELKDRGEFDLIYSIALNASY